MASFSLSGWDFALIVAVSTQALLLAYQTRPEVKAFLLTFPFPFTLATLSLGLPIEATHVLGLCLLFLFVQGVRIFHRRFGLHIVVAILAAASLYTLLGSLLAQWVPDEPSLFWPAAFFTLGVGLFFLWFLPARSEPAYRTPLPVWIKLPAVVGVVLLLVVMKHLLRGFMATFPMVGVIAAYESRYSLWTFGRQSPVIMVAVGLMQVAIFSLQGTLGLPLAVLVGWGVFGVAFPLADALRRRWSGRSLGESAVPGNGISIGGVGESIEEVEK